MPVVRLRAGTRGSLIAPARARTLSATQRRLHDAARLVVAPDPAVGRGYFLRELRCAHVHGLAQKRLPEGAERRSGDGHAPSDRHPARRDRKSTRLNSSHLVISYAVFCLKKKKKQQRTLSLSLFFSFFFF